MSEILSAFPTAGGIYYWALRLGGPVGIPKLWTGQATWFFYAAYEKYNASCACGGSPTATMPQHSWLTGDFSTSRHAAARGKDAYRKRTRLTDSPHVT